MALRFKIPTKEIKSADTIWLTKPKTPDVAVLSKVCFTVPWEPNVIVTFAWQPLTLFRKEVTTMDFCNIMHLTIDCGVAFRETTYAFTNPFTAEIITVC